MLAHNWWRYASYCIGSFKQSPTKSVIDFLWCNILHFLVLKQRMLCSTWNGFRRRRKENFQIDQIKNWKQLQASQRENLQPKLVDVVKRNNISERSKCSHQIYHCMSCKYCWLRPVLTIPIGWSVIGVIQQISRWSKWRITISHW